jgi:hypothetical protein
MEDVNSKWRRDAKAATAIRGDRVSLVLTDKGWRATAEGAVFSIEAPPFSHEMEEAIETCDQLPALHPEGWIWWRSAREWIREGWVVRRDNDIWLVLREVKGALCPASVQEFITADRARRWAEVRLDRVGANLKGPKPRAGKRSAAKLPDVRVTEAEKKQATQMLKAIGLSYSQFVRASIAFAEENIGESKGWNVKDGFFIRNN